jgi:hypothetical protein
MQTSAIGGGPTSIRVLQALQGSIGVAGEESITRNMKNASVGKIGVKSRHAVKHVFGFAAFEHHFSVGCGACGLA